MKNTFFFVCVFFCCFILTQTNGGLHCIECVCKDGALTANVKGETENVTALAKLLENTLQSCFV